MGRCTLHLSAPRRDAPTDSVGADRSCAAPGCPDAFSPERGDGHGHAPCCDEQPQRVQPPVPATGLRATIPATNRLTASTAACRSAEAGCKRAVFLSVAHQLITRLLSDCYGIQARGGCACAGPYVHRLLGIDEVASDQMRQAILSGNEIEKPGFVRLNLSPLMSDRKVQVVLDSVTELSRDAPDLERHYRCDPTSAIFAPVADMALA